MNKETWNSLDKEEQALWDKLKDTTKRKILQYAKDRATKKEKGAKVNVVTLEDEEASSSSEEPDTPNKNQEKSDGGEETLQVMKTAIIKSILEEAKAEAHPGDVRRMMGKKNCEGQVHAEGQRRRSSNMRRRIGFRSRERTNRCVLGG
jgi:1,2-phenylacetyl-CoA epoxidase PaaB subunit